MSFLRFFSTHAREVVGISMALAVGIGVLLGIFLTRRPPLAVPVETSDPERQRRLPFGCKGTTRILFRLCNAVFLKVAMP